MGIHFYSKGSLSMLDVQLLRTPIFADVNILQAILKSALFLVSTVDVAPRTNFLRRHYVVSGLLLWLCLLQPFLSSPSQISWSAHGSLFPGGFFRLCICQCLAETDTDWSQVMANGSLRIWSLSSVHSRTAQALWFATPCSN